MADSIVGRGVIEVVADSTKLKAGIAEAKRSINSLGDTNKATSAKASASIDRYIQKIGQQNAMLGMSVREMELYKLSLRGASNAQLKAADAALKMHEAYKKGERISAGIKIGFIAIAAAATAAGHAMFALTGRTIDQITSYQGLAEKMGDTAVNVATLKLAAELSGVALDTVTAASVKLTAALSKNDDVTKSTGAAIKALGIDYKKFKELSPVDQLDAIAKAMSGFADGAEKTAVAVALFGKSGAEMMPFFNDLVNKGQRHTTLTKEQIAATDDFNKAIVVLNSSFNDMTVTMVAQSIPALTSMQEIFLELSKDQVVMSTASSAFNATLQAGVIVFQTIAVAASEVGFVFLGVGREIAAISSQLARLARADIIGFRAISNAVKEDGERARAELDKFQARMMLIGQTPALADPANDGTTAGSHPRIDTSGLIASNAPKNPDSKDRNTAAQQAKAQLVIDLDHIKKQSDALTNTYTNAEKIMQAHRAAGLMDEREYYAAKLGFLNLNSAAQEKTLQKEIARMQAEHLLGNDKLSNDRKIADAQAKLAKLREDAVVKVQVNAIAENAALNKVAQAFRDAEDAAQSYLDTIRKDQSREIAGMGMGQQERDRTAGRAQIEDKYSGQRQGLENSRRDAQMNGTFGPDAQKKYDDELSRLQRFQATALTEYDSYYALRRQKENDWSIGASAAMQNYVDASRNVAQQTEDLFSHAFQGMEDALTTFISTGKLSFSGLANSILADLARIAAQQMISSLIGSMGGGWLGSAAGMIGGAASGKGISGQRANGGPVSRGGLYQVNEKGPEILNLAGRQYLMMGNQSGSVTPHSPHDSGGAEPRPTIIVNIHGGVAPDVRRAAGQGAREGLAAFQQAQRYT